MVTKGYATAVLVLFVPGGSRPLRIVAFCAAILSHVERMPITATLPAGRRMC